MPTPTENTNDKSINWKDLLTTAINAYCSSKTMRAKVCQFFGANNLAHAHQNTCAIILDKLSSDESNENAAVLFFALLKYLTVYRNSTELSNLLFKQYQSIATESQKKDLELYIREMKQDFNPLMKESGTNNYEKMIHEMSINTDKGQQTNINNRMADILNKLIANLPVQKPAIASPVQKQVTASPVQKQVTASPAQKQVTAQSQSTSVSGYESFGF